MKKPLISRSTLKNFVMTLAATTVSIILTFGTTAIVDRKKLNSSRREMALMLLYDMKESLTAMEGCEDNINAFFTKQVDIVANPEKFPGSWAELMSSYPVFEYSTTTENIFRSNIETISTIGNILFVQNVSSFYDNRARFREEVVDDFLGYAETAIEDYDALANFDSSTYQFLCESFIRALKLYFEQCKLMMKLDDGDLDKFNSYLTKIQKATENMQDDYDVQDVIRKMEERRQQLYNARQEGRPKL